MVDQDHPERRYGADIPTPSASPWNGVRCLLFEFFGGWTGLRRRVAIDIGQHTVSVSSIDGGATSPLASADRAQVTVTPAAFRPGQGDRGRKMPVLIVGVPGLEPMTIGCDVPTGGPLTMLFAPRPRFWWRGKVPWVKTPTYGARAEDWLTLVESLGMGPYLRDSSDADANDHGQQWVSSPQDLEAAAATGRDRRSVWVWFLASLLAALAVLAFVFAIVNCYEYVVGTPTTATVTECSDRSNCFGTWNIGGVPHTGPIAVEFSTPAVGSSLDVHVRGGTATTATFWMGGLVVGAVLAACSAVLLILTRSRTGTLVSRP